MFDANKPSYGRLLGSPDAAAHRKKPSAGAVLFPTRTELTRINIAIPKA